MNLLFGDYPSTPALLALPLCVIVIVKVFPVIFTLSDLLVVSNIPEEVLCDVS